MSLDRRAALALLLVLSSCSDSPAGPEPAGETVRARDFVIRSVDVVPMDTERVLHDRTVLVRDGVVASVAADGAFEIPAGAVVIDGEGLWLMPGLADMHVHVQEADLGAYLDHGVTTVRNMWGYEGLADLVERVDAGTLDGPRIRSLSPGIDGPPVHWPQTQLVTDPARADSVVQLQADRGYRTIKVYSDLRLDVYDALAAAAARRGMRFAGHVPTAVPVRHALESGQASIEHLGGYRTSPRETWPALAALTAAAGTYNCPTLSILAWSRGGLPEGLLDLVAVLHEAGAPLLVGTDSGIGLTAPGASVHEELAHLVDAGLTPWEALRGATRRAARWFGEEGTWGTVAPGMRADLLLLRENPLEDVAAVATHVGVLRGDLWRPLSPDP